MTKDANKRDSNPKIKHLTFRLGDSEYGVPLSVVKEVIGLPLLVEIPGGPNYFLGLINLRGKVITAIDLRTKLGFEPEVSRKKRQAIVVTDVGEIILGCVVDSISAVINISEADIDRDLSINIPGNRNAIQGVAHFKDRPMILLLDLKQAADISEVTELKSKELHKEGRVS
ncbi:MAG TPA: chemotaxis protein CheW [Pseudobdellovibrionaceae bacterium]|jgi:purine-binding chemotaxis protein CheW